MLIWFKTVVSTYCTLPFEVPLLGATVCADTRDTVSSERQIARKRWGKGVEAMSSLEGGGRGDEIQIE